MLLSVIPPYLHCKSLDYQVRGLLPDTLAYDNGGVPARSTCLHFQPTTPRCISISTFTRLHHPLALCQNVAHLLILFIVFIFFINLSIIYQQIALLSSFKKHQCN